MRDIITPSGYDLMNKKEKKEICNGAGAEGSGWLVPDTLWGLNCNKAHNRHDFGYYQSTKRIDKIIADTVYLWNLYSLIEKGSWWLRGLRKTRALTYAKVVNRFGDSSFFLKKTSKDKEFNNHSLNWEIIINFLENGNVHNYKVAIEHMIRREYRKSIEI